MPVGTSTRPPPAAPRRPRGHAGRARRRRDGRSSGSGSSGSSWTRSMGTGTRGEPTLGDGDAPPARPPSVDVDSCPVARVDTGLPHPICVDVARAAIAAGDPDAARRPRGRLPAHPADPGGQRHRRAAAHQPRAGARRPLAADARAVRPSSSTWPPASAGSRQRAVGRCSPGCAAPRRRSSSTTTPPPCCSSLAALADRPRGRRVARRAGRDRRRRSACPRSWPSPAHASSRWAPPTAPASPTTAGRSTGRGADVALVLKVHPSNYRIEGSPRPRRSPSWPTLGVPVVADIGSGLIDADRARGSAARRPRGSPASRPPPDARGRRRRSSPSAATSCSAARRPASSPAAPTSSPLRPPSARPRAAPRRAGARRAPGDGARLPRTARCGRRRRSGGWSPPPSTSCERGPSAIVAGRVAEATVASRGGARRRLAARRRRCRRSAIALDGDHLAALRAPRPAGRRPHRDGRTYPRPPHRRPRRRRPPRRDDRSDRSR